MPDSDVTCRCFSCDSKFWGEEFLKELSRLEEKAQESVLSLYDSSYEGYDCCCVICVVRTVLETVLPDLNGFFEEKFFELQRKTRRCGSCRPGCCRGSDACEDS